MKNQKPAPKRVSKKSNANKGLLDRTKGFFHGKPLLSYLSLSIVMMCGVLLLDQGTQFFKASVIQVPQFDGTTLPVKEVPNWVKTGGKNDRHYNDYGTSEFIDLPIYDGSTLKTKCAKGDADYRNACITYPVVYMGTYNFDHTEYAGSHIAVDIRIPEGTPVYSVANGVVETAVSKPGGFGTYVVIRHPNVPITDTKKGTLYSGYAHLSKFIVESGKTVKKGDLIGYSGNTGTSTTPHLHFQIDTITAPYHPWWPFSSTQASAAGLNFFSAINAGLGQEDGKKNTVSPLAWTQKYLNYSNGTTTTTSTATTNTNTSNTNTHSSAEDELGDFLIEADDTTITEGETIQFTITALKKDNKTFTSYTGSDAKFTANNDLVTIPELNFSKGKATARVTFPTAGKINFVIREGRILDSIKITVEEDDVPEIIIEEESQIDAVSLKADKKTLFLNKSTDIKITLYDEDGKIITDPDFSQPLEIDLDGVGEVNPKILRANDFRNGVAEIKFSSEEKAGDAEISIIGFPKEKEEIKVIEEVLNVHQFHITSEGKLTLGEKTYLIIETRDKNDNHTAKSFLGKAAITIKSGEGVLGQKTVTSNDFIDGEIRIPFTPASTDPVTIKVQSGAIVGTSDRMSVSTKERAEPVALFTDIDKDHPHYEAIQHLKKEGILKGNPDGTFRPESAVNRAEFAKVVLLALEISEQKAKGGVFTDVSKDVWFAPYAETAARKEIIKGYPDGTFGPGNSINRAELFTILVRASGPAVETEDLASLQFSDVPTDSWFAAAASFAEENDLLDFGRNFQPQKEMTRAEVAEAVSRFLEI